MSGSKLELDEKQDEEGLSSGGFQGELFYDDIDLFEDLEEEQNNEQEVLSTVLTEDDTLFENTPLHVVVASNEISLVQFLIESGTDINAKNRIKNTPLHVAASRNHIEVVNVLLEAGAKVNEKNNYGNTPLQEAVLKGNYNLAKALLEKGADINLANNQGETLLHLAALKSDILMVYFLLENGASTSVKDEDGNTPLLLAVQLKSHKADEAKNIVAKLLKQEEKIINEHNNHGDTALHIAVKNADAAMADMLLAAGADVHAKDSDGNTPLHLIAQSKSAQALSIAEALTAKGASVEVKNNQDQTPFLLAAQNNQQLFNQVMVTGYAEAASASFKNDPNINAVSNSAPTPAKGSVDVSKEPAKEQGGSLASLAQMPIDFVNGIMKTIVSGLESLGIISPKQEAQANSKVDELSQQAEDAASQLSISSFTLMAVPKDHDSAEQDGQNVESSEIKGNPNP